MFPYKAAVFEVPLLRVAECIGQMVIRMVQ